MKTTDMIKKAVKWYFEYAAMAYPYPDVVENLRTRGAAGITRR